ncbi:hypothetical protein KJ359_009130 [Pestalotiopsis sp. 9143b]|nr:hypothetical protein KJ359_009130 [Pestalotiopsis sp. 9143b]
MLPPHSFLSGGSSSGNDNFPFQFDLPESSLLGSQNSQQGLQGLSSAQKPAKMAFGEENFGNDAGDDMDLGLEIDADGNIFEDVDAAPAVADYGSNLPAMSIVHSPHVSPTKQQPHPDEQDDVLMMDEEALPDAEALPAGQALEKNNENDVPSESEQNHQPAPSRQKKRKVIHADSEIEIHRNELKRWQTEYLQNCGPQEQRTVPSSQAKENAIHLTFGLGIGNIGQSLGIPGMIHPLAMEFSGDSLFTAFTGLEVFEKKTPRKRGRPAKGEKKDEESEEPEERRVRPRLEENGNEEQQQHQEDDGLILDDAPEVGMNHSPPEIGREAQSAMDDHPSSAMPWNRGSSVMHGSSVQKPGSIQHGRELSSPLRGRGEDQDIVRYSSDVEMGGMNFGDGGHHSDDSFGSMAGPIATHDTPAKKESTQDQNLKLREALDREGNNFLGFVENMMPEHGERRHDEDFERRRKWIDFDDVFVPRETPRATAAQAFYHVLTLVTKGQMLVEQDGEGKEPFGGIHMGLEMPL